jgi:hypothetical protein
MCLGLICKEGSYVGLEVLTGVAMENSTFWDIMPYNPLKVTDFSEENITSVFGIQE